MRKSLLLLLVAYIGQAQNVYIPDAAFKSRLLEASPQNTTAWGGGYNIKIDANNDGEIQIQEAAAVDSLDISFGSIHDVTGIGSFSNLKTLQCSQNTISTLDLSGLSSLENLVANYSGLQSISLAGADNLKVLDLRFNSLTSLNVAGFAHLETLYCDFNDISSLVTENLPSLVNLYASSNPFTSIDVSTLASLEELGVEQTGLTSLDVSGLANLLWIYIIGPQFTHGPLTSVNLAGCVSLLEIHAQYNQLTTIDVSDCHNIAYLGLVFNYVETVFAKNGSVEDIYTDAAPLRYICADENQIADIQTWIDSNDINAVCNSYCSFVPGAPYNVISGLAHFDADGDGCDALDPRLENIRIDITDGTYSGTTFTDEFGAYTFYIQQPQLTLTAALENSQSFLITPNSATVSLSGSGNTEIRDFCFSAGGIHPDLEVAIVPIMPARPGFDATYDLIYHNKGTELQSGSVSLMFENAVVDFVAASPAPISIENNLLTWNFIDLAPFETRHVNLTLNVNSPMDTPAVNIDDELNFAATINPVVGDERPEDNVFGFKQVVVGSLDPNDKQCLQGETAPPSQIGQYLHYVINFENTGNFPAENVVIKDMIDADKFDISSLQVLGASHSETPVVTGNKLEFFFQGINLQPNAYGYVAYKIKTKPDLPIGTTVTNKANIYFDFNFPVETNTASTTFQNLGVGETSAVQVKIYPNPAHQLVSISSPSLIKSVTLYDLQGRIVAKRLFDASDVSIDLSGLSSGVYAIETATDSGRKIEKLIKR